MTTTNTRRALEIDDTDHQTTPRHHPYRWRLHRAGILDVWYYYDTEFDLSGGRLVLRGTNGSGKSRALEMLLPFVLDADRRRMDATGSGKVNLVDLMKSGAEDRSTRGGYVWLELARTVDPTDPADSDLHAIGRTEDFLTIGAHIRFSRSTGEAKIHYFTTNLRVGAELELLSLSRETLPREKLVELIGADRITSSPSSHRDRVRAAVFSLGGDSGAERYAGLLQLLHTLRSPDVGNRIDEGRLPQILSDALPPLSDNALYAAGEQLDGLSETRAAQERLETSLQYVMSFLRLYRRYAATAVASALTAAENAASSVESATKEASDRAAEHEELEGERGETESCVTELQDAIDDLSATIAGIKQSAAYASARDLDEREKRVDALGSAADSAIEWAGQSRRAEARAVGTANKAAEAMAEEGRRAAAALGVARTALEKAGASGSLPDILDVNVTPEAAITEAVRLRRGGDLTAFKRPIPDYVDVTPNDLDAAIQQITLVLRGINARYQHAETRLADARSLDTQHSKVEEAEYRAEEADVRAAAAAEAAEKQQSELEQQAVDYALRWREWCMDDVTVTVFGASPDISGTPLAAVLDAPALLLTDLGDGGLNELDQVAGKLARPVGDAHTRRLARLDAAEEQATLIRAALLEERAQLRSAIDPSPNTPAWLSPTTDDAVPLWRTIDFGDDFDSRDRAGLEGALLASGLLLATLHDDGALRAGDGQLLLTPTGAVDPCSVLGRLVPDPASPIASELVNAILSRVGFRSNHEPGEGKTELRSSIWVSTDGSWGSGPMTGRHLPVAARHIGATAREEARRTRLAAIERELGELDADEHDRAKTRAEVEVAAGRLENVTRNAPRTQAVSSATIRADFASTHATAERSAAEAALDEAIRKRSDWEQARRKHKILCSEFGLPDTVDDLDTVKHAISKAGQSCGYVGDHLTALNGLLERHRDALEHVGGSLAERREAETQSIAKWTLWHREASELESVRESVGREAADAQADLHRCETLHKTLTADQTQARTDLMELSLKVGAARIEARSAA